MDTGNNLGEGLKKFKDIKVIKHLGRENYHSLLNYIGKNQKGFCMGNSSSGVKETIFYNCPAINIGDRQKSRLKPKNVIDVMADKKKIINKIKKELNYYKIYENPYKLIKKFNSIPAKIIKKLSKKNLIEKKCTI